MSIDYQEQAAIVTLNDTDYIVGVWNVCDAAAETMTTVKRRQGADYYDVIIRTRIRRDDKVGFESQDEKRVSAGKIPGDVSEDSVIDTLNRANQACKDAYPDVITHALIVQGGPDRFVELASKAPGYHVMKVNHDDAN